MKIINNEITNNLLNNLKIVYQNNILEVENYKRILSFNDKEILLNKITIIGSSLKIIYIDKYIIKINGTIHLIKGEDINE